jgi:hypothetical protein
MYQYLKLGAYFRIISGYGLYSMYPYLHQSAQIAYQEIGIGLLLKFRSLKGSHHFSR